MGIPVILRLWAGHYFVVLVASILFLTLFPFPVSIAQFKGKFWNDNWSDTSNITRKHSYFYWCCVAPCTKVKQGALALPVCEAGRVCNATKDIFSDLFLFAVLHLVA